MEKSSRWQFTAFEPQFSIFDKPIPPGVAEWGWQTEEAPETGRKHYQGYIRLQQQQRFSWMKKAFPGVHVEIARNWFALLDYCRKEETRVPGTEQIHVVNDIPNKFDYATEVADRIVKLCPEYEEWSLEDALFNIHALVCVDLEKGRRGVNWIASNPDWITMWKKFWLSLLRAASKKDRQTDNQIISTVEHNPNAPSPETEITQSPVDEGALTIS